MTGLTFRRPFTLLGILLALLVITAFVLVALNAGASSNSPLASVVVATRDLAPRQPITQTALEVRQLPVPGTYPKVYFAKKEDVQGMIPLVAISAGQAISSNDIVKPNQALGSQAEYLPIPSGYVATTIPTSEQQGVANNIQPDDYISVIATVVNAGKVASRTVFTNLHVIRVGVPGSGASGASTATSLTVVVTECQAEVITWFLTYASLKYTLQSYKDYLTGQQPPDPKCPTVGDAANGKGVTLPFMQATYPGLF